MSSDEFKKLLTKDEVREQSILATQEALFKLGQQDRETSSKVNNEKEKYEKLRISLLAYKGVSEKSALKIISQKNQIEVKNILDQVVQFISITDNIIKRSNDKLIKIENEREDMKEEIDDYITETEDYENSMQSYWLPLQEKLERMNNDKRKLYKRLIYILICSNLNTVILTSYGINNYIFYIIYTYKWLSSGAWILVAGASYVLYLFQSYL